MSKSLFIVLDGPDGCGKSTQAARLSDRLRSTGRSVRHLREPGGTAGGERIRTLLLDPTVSLTSASEAFLFMAARSQLAHEQILPALTHSDTVVCERWISSTIAYQGIAGRFGVDKVVALGRAAVGDLVPSLLVLLDLAPEKGLARVKRGLDRMEQKGIDYHRCVRDGYLATRSLFPNTAVVDASASEDDVAASIWALVEPLL